MDAIQQLEKTYASLEHKPEILFHFGYPKTGTTTLQYFLANNQTRLRNKGIFYPLQNTMYGKHGFLIGWINQVQEDPFCSYLQKILTRIKPSDTKIIFSIEGVGFKTPYLSEASMNMLFNILKALEANVLFYFRDAYDFAWSWYKQSLINPPNHPIIDSFGRSLSFASFVTDEKIQFLLNYERFLSFWKAGLSEEKVTFRIKTNDIIADFLTFLNIEDKGFKRQKNKNLSISDSGIFFFSEQNEHLAQHPKLRKWLVNHKGYIENEKYASFREASFDTLDSNTLGMLQESNGYLGLPTKSKASTPILSIDNFTLSNNEFLTYMNSVVKKLESSK